MVRVAPKPSGAVQSTALTYFLIGSVLHCTYHCPLCIYDQN